MCSYTLDFESTIRPSERPFSTPNLLLMGAGPASCSPRILQALAQPSVGWLDPFMYKVTQHSQAITCWLPLWANPYHLCSLFQLKCDIREMLKYVLQTKNQVTFAGQVAGNGGLETILVNLVDRGEKVLIATGGFWGGRCMTISQMNGLTLGSWFWTALSGSVSGIEAVEIASKPGEVFSLKELEEAILQYKPVMLFITHGESSGGTIQPLEGLGVVCRK